MNTRIIKIFRFSLLAMMLVGGANASQAPNPRSATTNVAPQRAEGRDVKRLSAVVDASRSAMRRPTTTVSRSNANVVSTSAAGIIGRNAVRQNVVAASGVARPDITTARSAAPNVVRSAVTHSPTGSARSATNMSVAGVSRAATARATAVFDDVSKIGGGYASCRDAYSTCMDQFCAKANETYRRCFCSSKFTQFRDTENALEEAKLLLMRFEDNNLNAVDKTAAEVSAMYSATEGEMAIKNDTSGAAAMLAEIGDLLSGKKTAVASNNSGSLGILNFDFSTDMDDVWNGDSDSLFSGGSGQNLTNLEAQALYNAANKQCLNVISDSCENNAVLTMAKSSYSILISQDCNAYEKKINSARNAVEQTVRTAEKYLREARLEEYRSHNSADVNECISKVKSAIMADTACGENYKRCLDYSGVYINQTTGEPIYGPRLFQLQEQINLNGEADVLAQNPNFNKFLDTKYMFAQSALNTCRDISDMVWSEFKRTALIEISQAQDAKIEEVKSSCVSTMAECYDTQTSAMKEFDTTTAQAAGALSAYAAKAMCQDKVAACAALYGNGGTCQFDKNGRLTNASSCGLTQLLAFVDAVDTVRVAEGCATAIDGYVKELCTPTAGAQKFPWNCRNLNMRSEQTGDNAATDTSSVEGLIKRFAVNSCSDPTVAEKTYSTLPIQTQTQVEKAVSDIAEQLDFQLQEACEEREGYWLDSADKADGARPLAKFYSDVFGGNQDGAAKSAGICVKNTVKVTCENYNEAGRDPVAVYDAARDVCNFTEEWYRERCAILGNGYYENGVCYVSPSK